MDSNQSYAQVMAEQENGQLTVEYVHGDDLLSQTNAGGLAVYLSRPDVLLGCRV